MEIPAVSGPVDCAGSQAGRSERALGSQPRCRRCGAVDTCGACLASLKADRLRHWDLWVACDAALEARALSLEERRRRYARADEEGSEPRRPRPRDRFGYGAGVRPRRALSQAEAEEYGVSRGVLVNLRTGEVARSDG